MTQAHVAKARITLELREPVHEISQNVALLGAVRDEVVMGVEEERGIRPPEVCLAEERHGDQLVDQEDVGLMAREERGDGRLYPAAAELLDPARRPALRLCLHADRARGSFYKPTLTPHAITGAFELAGLPVVPFEQDHGFSKTLGLRIGGMAYSTDVVDLDDAAFAVLAGVELWIVDCLRYDPHPTHSHVAKTLSWIERVKPRRAVLTHMDVDSITRRCAASCRRALSPAMMGL